MHGWEESEPVQDEDDKAEIDDSGRSTGDQNNELNEGENPKSTQHDYDEALDALFVINYD